MSLTSGGARHPSRPYRWGGNSPPFFSIVIFMCMLDTSRFEFIEKLLNTPDIKSILGKLDDSGKWNQHGRGENVVNRFEFEFSEIDEDEREELVKSGFKEIKYKFTKCNTFLIMPISVKQLKYVQYKLNTFDEFNRIYIHICNIYIDDID